MTRREARADDVISAEGLCMRYRTKDVLRDVSFQLCRGEVVALLGPNGAGKPVTDLRLSSREVDCGTRAGRGWPVSAG